MSNFKTTFKMSSKLKFKITSLPKNDDDSYLFELSQGRKKIAAKLDNSDIRSIIRYFDNKIK